MGSPLVQYWNGALLTDWIDGSVKPTIVGVYLRRIAGREYFSEWDGRRWCGAGHTALEASCVRAVSSDQSALWRGLAHDPAFDRELPR